MRNIRTLFIIAGISVLICIFIISAVLFQTLNSNNIQTLEKQKKESRETYNRTLKILPSPQNGSREIAIDSFITIKLQNPKPYSDIAVTISPEIPHKISHTDSLIVIYHENLDPGTTYTLLVSATNKDKTVEYESFSFTTKGLAPNLVNTNGSTNLAKKSNEFQLNNHPDIFLSNYIPYETDTFSIDQADANSGSLQFFVMSKGDKNAAKNDFISWARSLGLSDEQLKIIRIIYK